jgi:hypothetical protein
MEAGGGMLAASFPMNPSDRFVCKPTSWLPIRATAMFLLFGTFAWLFYHDGSVGYRRKNAALCLHQTFKAATEEFAQQNRTDTLTAGEWKKYASRQTVKFPDDASLLPPELPRPMPWPAVLQDFERMKKLNPEPLWTEFTASWQAWKMAAEPPEHFFDAQKIREQWIVGGICAVLALGGLFVLLRTLKRSIAVDGEAIYLQNGRRVPFSDLIRLDLRKWEAKGLALADFKGASGAGRIRIDGLIYGGFSKEHGEPAEELLRRIKARFSGELVAYGDASPGGSRAPEPDK